jgi:hypothetical protein
MFSNQFFSSQVLFPLSKKSFFYLLSSVILSLLGIGNIDALRAAEHEISCGIDDIFS